MAEDDLNPGIRKTVAWLNALGFSTCDSGDGKTHDHECDRDEPYVVIQLKDPSTLVAQADGLQKLIEERGIEVAPFDYEPQPGKVSIQANYWPVSNLGIIDVVGLDDELLESTL